MRNDLSTEDFELLLARHRQLTQTTRRLYGLSPARELDTTGSTPFELMWSAVCRAARAAIAVFVVAVFAVTGLALALAGVPGVAP